MKRMEIRKLQAALFLMDFTADGHLIADGEAGEYTAQAVTAYLDDEGIELSEDGSVNMEVAFSRLRDNNECFEFFYLDDEDMGMRTLQCVLIIHIGGDAPNLIADGVNGEYTAQAVLKAVCNLYIYDKRLYFNGA